MKRRRRTKESNRARYFEALERRVLLSGSFLPLATHKEMIFDDARNELLIVADQAQLLRYDMNTQQFLTPFQLSGDPGEGDITPDGKYLYLSDGSATEIHKVDLDTGQESVLSYSFDGGAERASTPVVILSNNIGYFSSYENGSGNTWPLRQIDLATDTISTAPAPLNNLAANTVLFRSADRSTMLINQLSASDDPIAFYNVAGNTITGTGNVSTGWWRYGISAVSRDGQVVATADRASAYLSLRNQQLGIIQYLPTGSPFFSPAFNRLYILADNTNTVQAYDTTTLSLRATYNVSTTFSMSDGTPGVGMMTASADGKYLFVGLSNGVKILNVNQGALPTPTISAPVTDTYYGDQVQVTATLPPGLWTGTLEFFSGSFVWDVQSIDGVNSASTTITAQAVGTGEHVTARFFSQEGLFGETSNELVLTVEKAMQQPQLLLNAAGDSTTPPQFEAALAGPPYATGTISFYDGDALFATASLVNGRAYFTPDAPMTAGTHTITAVYSGDGNFEGGTSLPLALTIAQLQSAVSLSVPSTVNAGQKVQLAAHVSNAGAIPTGTVSFYDNGVLLGSMEVDNAGDAAASYLLGLGTHSLIAAYSGQVGILASVGAAQKVAVAKVVPSIRLLSSTTTVAVGGDAGLTASVLIPIGSPVVPYVPAPGTVSIYDGNKFLGTASLDNSPDLSVPLFTVGPHKLMIAYAGTAEYAAVNSAPITINVIPMTYVDLLALYTPTVISAAGGVGNVLFFMKQQVAHANEAFANSGVAVMLRLVSLSFVNYQEAGSLGTDLSRLHTNGDGYLDNVPALRNAVGADLVVLVDAHATHEAGDAPDLVTAGIADTLLNVNAPQRDSTAYVVIAEDAPDPTYVLAHEVAHTFGATHAIGDPTDTGATTYAHGYRFVGNDGRTYHDIMAYDPGTQIPYFSSPALFYQGKSIGNTQTADVARLLREQAPKVSAYRTAGILGGIDSFTATAISGWFWDPKLFDAPVTMRVDVDGVTQGTFTANAPRPDLNSAFGTTAHGFSYNLPVLKPGQHTVAVYVQNNFAGTFVLVASRTITTPPLLFDEAYYLANNPDVAAAVKAGQFASGWDHFQAAGQFEGRNPSLYFDTAYYLAHNPDLAAAYQNGTLKSPFAHYLATGQYEMRAASPNFDEKYYRSANPDVADAIRRGVFKSGLEHFLLAGRAEGRSGIPPA